MADFRRGTTDLTVVPLGILTVLGAGPLSLNFMGGEAPVWALALWRHMRRVLA